MSREKTTFAFAGRGKGRVHLPYGAVEWRVILESEPKDCETRNVGVPESLGNSAIHWMQTRHIDSHRADETAWDEGGRALNPPRRLMPVN